MTSTWSTASPSPPVSSKGRAGVWSKIAWNAPACVGSCPEPAPCWGCAVSTSATCGRSSSIFAFGANPGAYTRHTLQMTPFSAPRWRRNRRGRRVAPHWNGLEDLVCPRFYVAKLCSVACLQPIVIRPTIQTSDLSRKFACFALRMMECRSRLDRPRSGRNFWSTC